MVSRRVIYDIDPKPQKVFFCNRNALEVADFATCVMSPYKASFSLCSLCCLDAVASPEYRRTFVWFNAERNISANNSFSATISVEKIAYTIPEEFVLKNIQLFWRECSVRKHSFCKPFIEIDLARCLRSHLKYYFNDGNISVAIHGCVYHRKVWNLAVEEYCCVFLLPIKIHRKVGGNKFVLWLKRVLWTCTANIACRCNRCYTKNDHRNPNPYPFHVCPPSCCVLAIQYVPR